MAIDYYYTKRDDSKVKSAKSRAPQILVEEKQEYKKHYIIDNKRLTIVIIVFAFIAIIWWIFISKIFIVQDIIYESEPSPNIKQRIEDLRGNNILLLQLSKLSREWQKDQPVIKSLHIYRGLPHTLRVGVEERNKAIVWKSNDNYYLIDSTGVVYEDSGSENKENFLPIIDDNNLDVILGTKIVSSDFVDFVKNLMDNISGKIGDETIKELHVGESIFNIEAITDKDINIKFDITQPLDLQLEALDYIYKEKRGDVKEYVDVRVIGKAYIK